MNKNILRPRDMIRCTAFLLISVLTLLVHTQSAMALCCRCEKQVEKAIENQLYEGAWGGIDKPTVQKTVSFIEGELTTLKAFLFGLMWEDNILPSLMMMAEETNVIAMQQVHLIGTLFDAKLQVDTLRELEVARAEIHKRYQPSQGICEFGTSIKSLAATDRKQESTAIMLNERALERETGAGYSSAYLGPVADEESRVNQFVKTYCDKKDNNNGLGAICDVGNTALAYNAARRNKDIDFSRVIDFPRTLNVNYTDAHLTNPEEDVLALSSNLYGQTVFKRPFPKNLTDSANGGLSNGQSLYMDQRSIMAKRNVARSSFNAITAMKAKGTSASREFLLQILYDLGFEEKDAKEMLLGDSPNRLIDPEKINGMPSYYAQMDMLTKKIYQNPDFYTQLYDTPVNVDRKGVALQAIGLMQKFDLLKSYLRREANVSLLLELSVMDLQEKVENEAYGLGGGR